MIAGLLIAALAISPVFAQGLPAPVQAAVADLAQRLGIEQSAVTVASIEEVTWQDASLGNPQPGQFYAQVMTPGYRVFLVAQGGRFEYHTDMNRNITLVGAPAPEDGQTPLDPEEQEAAQRVNAAEWAKQDIAARLGISADRVYLAAMEERDWTSGALGVEEPGQSYTQAITPGYRLVLETGDGLYEYHTDLTGIVKPGRPGQLPALPQDYAAPAPAPAATGPAADAAVADLAARLDLRLDEIRVVSVEDVQWPSGSLGMPEPGMMYTLALVAGQRIVLEARDRQFEYRSAQNADSVRYAGVLFPEDAEVALLAMTETEPADGNNSMDLVCIDARTEQRETVVELISDYAATPDGRDLLVKRRTSRSGHALAYMGPDGAITPLADAFDFQGMALRPDGQMAAYWARPSLGDQTPVLTVVPKPWEPGNALRIDLAAVPPSFAPGEIIWTDDALAFTVYNGDDPRAFLWTVAEGLRDLGAFEIVAWIPRTRALLTQRQQGGQTVLASFIPEMGETATLATVPAIQSVAAPIGEQWVVAVVSGAGGPELQRITWGGMTQSLAALSGARYAQASISPVGQIAAAEYRLNDEPRVDLHDLGADGATQVRVLRDIVGVTVIAD